MDLLVRNISNKADHNTRARDSFNSTYLFVSQRRDSLLACMGLRVLCACGGALLTHPLSADVRLWRLICLALFSPNFKGFTNPSGCEIARAETMSDDICGALVRKRERERRRSPIYTHTLLHIDRRTCECKINKQTNKQANTPNNKQRSDS